MMVSSQINEIATSGILKQASQFIQQIGFPIVAFLLMFYVVVCSQQKMTDAITTQTKVLAEMNITMQEFKAKVQADHDKMQQVLTELKYGNTKIKTE